VDHELGTFTAGLRDRLGDRSMLIVTADHGEALGPEDDGTYLHGHSVFDEVVRVPLVMVAPWIEDTQHVTEPVSLLDLGPTLLDLAGIAAPTEFLGRSLFAEYGELHPPVAAGERLEPPWKQGPVQRAGRSTVAEWFVREGPWKLVMDAQRSWLFHLPTDAKETVDRSAERPEIDGHLMTIAWRTSPALEPGSPQAPEVGVDAGERRQLNDALKALGYVE
jgi:arylsulfatase A-like enzyme